MNALEDIMAKLDMLQVEERIRLEQTVEQQLHGKPWIPTPGPQTNAYLSLADVLLYGGQAGGGKTHLEIGWGVNEADAGIIFRRELTQTDGLEKEGKRILGIDVPFNGKDLEWALSPVRSLKLGGMRDADSWQAHAGRERDYIAFDEGGEFLEVQVSSIMAWLRAPPGKRTRVIIGSNPPRNADGLWLIKWFAPWLDDRFINPAQPGELRWACYVWDNDEGRMVWVDGPGEHTINGEPYTAKSYTFIPASLEDNPYRNTKEYRAQLQSLREPLRSQLLYGKFSASLKDQENQLIPTEWIRAAQERWTPRPPLGVPMCAIGVDASGGGDDPLVLAPRYDGWFAELVEIPGQQIPVMRVGAYCAGVIVSHRKDGATVVLDMGGGYGGPIFEKLIENDIECVAWKGAEASFLRAKDRKLGFVNKRSQAYWQLKEALDPDQPGGSPIALPPGDRRLLADLAAPTFEITARGIAVEPKVKVNARLGRSTDRGDAVAMSWAAGARQTTHSLEWMQEQKFLRHGVRPQVITGRVLRAV